MRPQWLFGSSKMNNLIQFPELIPSTMAQKPLEILKKGLTKINGGDDVDDDINTSHEPPPTRRDVLKAISTIGKYTDDMNDPIARKMEAILGTFTRQLRLDETRTMKNSVLTDFFDLT